MTSAFNIKSMSKLTFPASSQIKGISGNKLSITSFNRQVYTELTLNTKLILARTVKEHIVRKLALEPKFNDVLPGAEG